jgi:hypothetical protein
MVGGFDTLNLKEAKALLDELHAWQPISKRPLRRSYASCPGRRVGGHPGGAIQERRSAKALLMGGKERWRLGCSETPPELSARGFAIAAHYTRKSGGHRRRPGLAPCYRDLSDRRVVARKTRSPARRPSGPLRSDRQPARSRARRSIHADRDRGWHSCGSPGVAWQRGAQTSKESVEDEHLS